MGRRQQNILDESLDLAPSFSLAHFLCELASIVGAARRQTALTLIHLKSG